MSQPNTSDPRVEELLAQYAGAGLDDLKDWHGENLRRIAEHFNRTDFAAIREEYDAGSHDDFLWPMDEDEAEFLERFQREAPVSVPVPERVGDLLLLPGATARYVDTRNLKAHPSADDFPLMALDHPNYVPMVEDLRTHGLLNPIWLHPADGSILDGRNRYQMCREARVPWQFVFWAGEAGDEWRFVASQNLHRRDLTSGQRLMWAHKSRERVAARVALNKAAKNKERALAQARGEGGQFAADSGVFANLHRPGETTNALLARMTGESPRSLALLDKLCKEAPDLGDQLFKGSLKNLNQANKAYKAREALAKRAKNAEAIGELPPTNEGLNCGAKFSTIVIDPPWDYNEKNNADSGGMIIPYATMPFAEIEALKMPAADDCAIFLWTTNAFLPQSFALLEKWGFRYSATLTWCKVHSNGSHRFSSPLAQYFKISTEFVLFGVRGKLDFMPGQDTKNADTWFTAEIGPSGHSSKPPEFLKMVESWVPGPYLEIFSRSESPGWSSYGQGGLILSHAK